MRATGRTVKFARLLGAALNTGVINALERSALAVECCLFYFSKATCGY